MSDLISRQAAIDVIRAMQTYKLFAGDDMILVDQAGVQTELMMLPSAQPTYTDAEIQKMQDLEQVQIEKAYRLGYEDGEKDAQPERKKGKWLPDNRPGGGFWVCSCCKFPSEAFAADVLYKFCPNCGADMRQEKGQ